MSAPEMACLQLFVTTQHVRLEGRERMPVLRGSAVFPPPHAETHADTQKRDMHVVGQNKTRVRSGAPGGTSPLPTFLSTLRT